MTSICPTAWAPSTMHSVSRVLCQSRDLRYRHAVSGPGDDVADADDPRGRGRSPRRSAHDLAGIVIAAQQRHHVEAHAVATRSIVPTQAAAFVLRSSSAHGSPGTRRMPCARLFIASVVLRVIRISSAVQPSRLAAWSRVRSAAASAGTVACTRCRPDSTRAGSMSSSVRFSTARESVPAKRYSGRSGPTEKILRWRILPFGKRRRLCLTDWCSRDPNHRRGAYRRQKSAASVALGRIGR